MAIVVSFTLNTTPAQEDLLDKIIAAGQSGETREAYCARIATKALNNIFGVEKSRLSGSSKDNLLQAYNKANANTRAAVLASLVLEENGLLIRPIPPPPAPPEPIV